MRVLLDDLPHPLGVSGDADPAELYAYPPQAAERAWVRANFVATLDGAVTGSDGRSGSINTEADRVLFTLLRALADIIVVGATTARTEEYRRARTAERWRTARGAQQSAHPTIAVVSRSARLPATLLRPRADAGATMLITCRAAGPAALERARRDLGDDAVLVVGQESVDLGAALDALAARGLRRVLCEGGPHLLHALTAADRLDELCLTLAPRIVAGEHLRMLSGPPLDAEFSPRMLVESDGTVAGRWLRTG